ncbi:hypothetical protein E2C01_076080 [Portunus trituberculatus]|uniref:Uncharacterized protein n=1 Tax=Portunus trituberculatus TaxID=210409 RepID=A0A5B7IGK4_PORTR|nr:hypothetical protein [Portunus trituberculatus]
MCDGFNDYCSNGEDKFVQLCGIDECREKNGECEHLCLITRHTTGSAGRDLGLSGSSTVKTLTSAWNRSDPLPEGLSPQ